MAQNIQNNSETSYHAIAEDKDHKTLFTSFVKELRVLNVLAFVACLIGNGVGGAGLITGIGIGEVSKMYPTMITPADYAFSIWGLIYTLILVFVIYQALPENTPANKNSQLLYSDIGTLFIVNMIVNGLWCCIFTIATPEAVTACVLIIFVQLVTIILMQYKIFYYVEQGNLNFWEYLSLRIGNSIYGGWVTGATIINVTTAFYAWGFHDGTDVMVGTEEEWSVLILALTTILFMLFTILRRDIVWGLVYVWIAVGLAEVTKSTAILYTGYAGIGVIVLTSLIIAVKYPKNWLPCYHKF